MGKTIRKSPRYISFAARGTLLHDSPHFEKWCFSFLKSHSVSLSDVEWQNSVIEALRAVKSQIQSGAEIWDLHEVLIRSLLRKYLPQEKIDSAIEGFRASSRLVIPEETFELMKYLKEKGIRLGLLSNEPVELLEILRAHFLLDYFDFALTRSDLPKPKPSTEAFSILASEFGCEPNEIFHVGDSFVFDVQGAQALGIQTVLYDPTTFEVATFFPQEGASDKESKVVSMSEKRAIRQLENTLVIHHLSDLQKVF